MSHPLDSIMTKSPIIPVVTLERAEDGVPLAEALLKGGVKIIEITLRTEEGAKAIAEVAKHVPEMCVGAGTVTNADQFKQAVDAGSQFIVSPGLTDKLAKAVQNESTPFLPGVATVTEVMHAREWGYTHLKFFPASLFGGVSTLKQYSGLFSELRFCPTGGVSAANVQEYLAIPHVLCCGGSWIAPQKLINGHEWGDITKLCEEAIELING